MNAIANVLRAIAALPAMLKAAILMFAELEKLFPVAGKGKHKLELALAAVEAIAAQLGLASPLVSAVVNAVIAAFAAIFKRGDLPLPVDPDPPAPVEAK